MHGKTMRAFAIAAWVFMGFGCSDGKGSDDEGGSDDGSAPTSAADLGAGMTGNSAPGGQFSNDSAGVADRSSSAGGATTSGGTGLDVEPVVLDRSQGDRYEAVGTNPFVMTAHDPFSTFAADVDTASYDIFRRDVAQGLLPQAASVRLEEFVNYFAYDYEAPSEDDEHPFRISLDAAPSVFDRPTTVLRVGIQARKPPPEEKKPANIVFLIDTSGSMQSEEKLPLVQRVLTQSLDALDSDDTIAIVTYAGSTGVALEPTPVSERDTIVDTIESFGAGGSTAGAAGITLAYEQARAGYLEGGINHVILCTDGDFNVGPYSDDELVELIEQERKSGVTLTALGFGYGNLNDSMMEKVSNAGNGTYSVITSRTHADRYAETALLSSLVYVAKDMKIQVEFNSETVLAYRLLGYENRDIADEDFRDDDVDAGEVGAGHRVTALYELVMAGGNVPEGDGSPEVQDGEPVEGEREIADSDLVLVKVRYKDVDAGDSVPAEEVTRTLAPEQVAASLLDLDGDFQWALGVAALAELLKESPYADPTLLGQLGQLFEDNKGDDGDRRELAELFETVRASLE